MPGLARFGHDSRAVLALTAGLHESHPYVRKAAAQGLGEIGPAAERAVPAFRDLLDMQHGGDHSAVADRELFGMLERLDFWDEAGRLSLRDAAASALARITSDGLKEAADPSPGER